MYIFWSVWPSPGIEPRIPTVSRSSAGSHTSIVAHSSCDCSSLCSAGVVWLDCAEADAVSASAGTSAATAARQIERRVGRTTL